MKALFTLLLGLLAAVAAAGAPTLPADTATLRLTTLPAQGIELLSRWCYYPADSAAFAQPNYDDRRWLAATPTVDGVAGPLRRPGIGWLRLHWQVGPALAGRRLYLLVSQSAATEVYLNGQLVQRLGTLSAQPGRVRAYSQALAPVVLPPLAAGPQVLAVRLALPAVAFWLPNPAYLPPVFRARLLAPGQLASWQQRRYSLVLADAVSAGALLLGLLHLTFFCYSPAQRANLYFALFALSASVPQVLTYSVLPTISNTPITGQLAGQAMLRFCLALTGYLWAVRALYALLGRAPGWWFWALCGALGVALVLWFSRSDAVGQVTLAMVFVLGLLEPVRLTVQGWRRGRRGIGFVALGFAGALGSLLFAAGLRVYQFYHHITDSAIVLDNLVQLLLTLSPALGISLFLAYEFALDARLLQAKLGEVEHLSAQALRQEQEKQLLLATQNDTLERQVAARTAEVLTQRNNLERALTELRATQGQLIQREKMASLGELTAGIAHEIQNPLNFVNNFAEVSAELLADLKAELAGGSPAEAQALADDLTTNLLKIKDHGGRASGIVRGMLAHSREGGGEHRLVNVNALCDEYLRLAYHGLRAKDKGFNATLQTDFASALPPVEAVPGDLGRVLLNLLTNAFYAVQKRQQQEPPGYAPTVAVRTRQLGGRVQIEVQDNGTGIPAAIQAKIFQPFFTTKPTGEGTGLGLSLSYDIITQGHGGTLAVASEAGAGTTFTLQLPLPTPSQP